MNPPITALRPIVLATQAKLVPDHLRDEAYGVGMEEAYRAWLEDIYIATAVRFRTIDWLRKWTGYHRATATRPTFTGLTYTDSAGEEAEKEALPYHVDDLESIDTRLSIETHLVSLTQQELEVYRMYVLEEMNQAAIAGHLHVTESRVNQIWKSVMAKLKRGVNP